MASAYVTGHDLRKPDRIFIAEKVVFRKKQLLPIELGLLED